MEGEGVIFILTQKRNSDSAVGLYRILEVFLVEKENCRFQDTLGRCLRGVVLQVSLAFSTGRLRQHTGSF